MPLGFPVVFKRHTEHFWCRGHQLATAGPPVAVVSDELHSVAVVLTGRILDVPSCVDCKLELYASGASVDKIQVVVFEDGHYLLAEFVKCRFHGLPSYSCDKHLHAELPLLIH